jgi:23S rRNA (cytosine1962-C5)-methyltransferase
MPAPTPTATVSHRGAKRIASGHPWIFRSDVESLADAKGGDVVRVVDTRGWFQGWAFYSEKSQISLRMLTRDDTPVDDSFFQDRIHRAIALRRIVFPDASAVRLIHGEADLLPGLIVDQYPGVLVLQLLNQAADARRGLFVSVLSQALGIKAIVERSDAKVRGLEGLLSKTGPLSGEVPKEVVYRERDVQLRVDITGGQKTGAFLDQRENRIAAEAFARGTCLDCFSYTGAFAMHLARSAERVIAVEVSEEASRGIAKNAELNGFKNVEVVTANAFDHLSALSKGADRFDVVVLDPPAFAKNKAALPGAERGYKEINLRAFQILRPGGVLLTSSCSFHLSEERFEELLISAARDAKRQVQVIERRGAGRDHPVLLSLPETRYLKCWILRVV